MAAPPNPLALFVAQVREAYALEEHAVEANMVNNYPPGHLQYVSDDALIEYEKAILDLYTAPAAAVVPPWFGPAYAAAAAVPPPWFVPAIAAATAAALPPVLTAALAPLKAILNQMDENLTELSMCYCKDLNSFRQMPHVGPFHEVLLPDGRRPWNLVHNLPGPIPVVLPPLIDSQSIQNLSVNESRAYFILYYPNHDVGLYPHLLRLPEIRRAIGRPA